MDIDFTEWTDAQLDAANTPRMIAASPKTAPGMLTEIERRKAAGIWMTDGSRERVDALIASSRPRRRRSVR